MPSEPTPGRVKALLALGVVCISFPAILFRLCNAPPLTAAFWRKAMAAAMLLPVVAVELKRSRPSATDYGKLSPMALGTGLLLAVHFASWFFALEMTSVSSAVVLVCTQPIWSAIIGGIFLKEKIPARDVAAIGISIAGASLIAFGDGVHAGWSLAGDALALLGAVCAAAYLTAGRVVRDRVPLSVWLVAVYGVAAVVLAVSVGVTGGKFTGFDGRTWAMLVAMALIPSTLGHNLLNYAVRHMETHKVTVCTLAEPIVSTALAALLFNEHPTALFYPGAALVFASVWLVI